jgi:hypothetical protein
LDVQSNFASPYSTSVLCAHGPRLVPLGRTAFLAASSPSGVVCTYHIQFYDCLQAVRQRCLLVLIIFATSVDFGKLWCLLGVELIFIIDRNYLRVGVRIVYGENRPV